MCFKMADKANHQAIFFCFIVVAFSGVLSLSTSRDVNMLDFPEPTKMAILGEKLELQWKYRVNKSANNKWKISLYEYNYRSGTKTKLLALLESGITILNPNYVPLGLRKFNMELSYDKAQLSISNTTLDDSSAGYGIVFQAHDGNGGQWNFEKFTEINIVEAKAVEVPSRHTGKSSCLRPCHSFAFLMLFCFLVTKIIQF